MRKLFPYTFSDNIKFLPALDLSRSPMNKCHDKNENNVYVVTFRHTDECWLEKLINVIVMCTYKTY